MNALLSIFLAASFASASNLFFRKNASAEPGNCSQGFLVIFYLLSFLLSLLIFPEIWNSSVNFIILGMGACVGVFNVAIMSLTAKALNKGPAGLTFTFQNASTIFPGMLLFLLFGSEFGFTFAYTQLVGMVCVLFGLFLGSKRKSNDSGVSTAWLFYAFGCFALQIIALTLIQGRCILFDAEKPFNFFSSFSCSEHDDVWFMPGMFGSALLLQVALFLFEHKKFRIKEIINGSLSGISNSFSTLFLLFATKWALPHEKIILFPFFAVVTIILCNLWAYKFYKEKFNFASNGLCAIGIFMSLSRV